MNHSFAKTLLSYIFSASIFLLMTSCEETENEPDPTTPVDSTSKKTGWKGSDDPNTVPENLNNPFESDPSTLPASFDLTPFFPPVGDQGQYGTCVAWATAYNAKTAMEAIKFGLTSSQLSSPNYQLSPKYLFTALADDKKGENCNGTDFTPALDVMLNRGVATKAIVPYNNLGNCSSSGLQTSWDTDAAKHKIKYFRKIDDNQVSVKQAIAAKMPVILGAKLDDSFMSWNSETVYQNATSTAQVGIHAYHAMCIVGYDNSKGPRGAFKVVNSWSNQWGANGFIWVDYNFMFNGFAFNKNFFVAVNDDQRPNPGTDPDPVTSGVELAPWVDADYSEPDSGGTWRAMEFDLFNIGSSAAPASSDWGFAYVYYNAYNANDYGVVFYDRLKNQGPYKSISFGQTDASANAYGFFINANIPSGQSLSSELFTGEGLIRTYLMPGNLNGLYYLVLVADVTDKFTESDESNNLFYTTDQEPKLFVNGVGSRVNMMADGFKNVFTKSEMQTNGARERYHTAVKPRYRNAYTPEEILTFLKKEAKNGNLGRKVHQVGHQKGTLFAKRLSPK
jgi:C1A family cysteine protease